MRIILVLFALLIMACTAPAETGFTGYVTTTDGGTHAAFTFSSTTTDPLTVARWEVDPSNLSACASDSNSCTAMTCDEMGNGPCATMHGVVAKYGTYQPQITAAGMTVHVMGPGQVTGWGTDVFDFMPTYDGAGSFLLLGDMNVVRSTTLTSYTPLNRTLGSQSKGKITASGITSWASYIGYHVFDVTAGAYFVIEKDEGGGVADISTPLSPPDPSVFYLMYSYITPHTSDAIQIWKGSEIECGMLGGQAGFYPNNVMVNIRCAGTDVGAASDTTIVNMGSANCEFPPRGGYNFITTCSSGYHSDDAFEAGSHMGGSVIGGIATNAPNFDCREQIENTVVDGDMLLDDSTGASIHLATSISLGRVYQSSVFDPDGHAAELHIGQADYPGLFFADVNWWGPLSYEVFEGLRVTFEWNATSLNLQGAPGSTLPPISVFHYATVGGLPWIRTTGTWGATPVAITPANLILYGAIGDPSTGDIVSDLYSPVR